MPKRHREILVETRTGGRADGVDEAALEAEVRLIVEDYAGRRSRRGWTGSRPNWAGQRVGGAGTGGRDRRAAGSPAETVVLTDKLPADRQLWTTGGLEQVATKADGLVEGDAVKQRADEVLPAAASVSGANLVVPDGYVELADGVGALLRY
ncbi:hypothetical protein GCM10018954_101730 [Kutzneria kofuensis]